MPLRERFSLLTNKLALKFILYSIIISLFPVAMIYIHSSSYFTIVDNVIQSTNDRLISIVKEQDTLGQSELTLEDVQKKFNILSIEASNAMSDIKIENYLIIIVSVLCVISIALITLYKYKNEADKLKTSVTNKNNIGKNQKENSKNVKGITEAPKSNINKNEINLDNQAQLQQLLESHIFAEEIPDLRSLKIYTHRSASGKGGNYSFFSLSDDKLAFMIVEPTGEKNFSLFISNYFQFFFKQEFQNYAGPEYFSNALNKKILSLGIEPNLVIPAFIGVIDLRELHLTYVNCGFRGMIYFDYSGNGVEAVSSDDPPFGEKTLFTKKELQLMLDDRLLFYNRPLSIGVHKGMFSLKSDSASQELIAENSFPDLVNKLPEIVQNGLLGETTILFELKELYKDPVESVSTFFEEGTRYFLNEDYKKALESFHRVMKVNPKHMRALTNIGLVHYKQNDYDKAYESWERVLSFDPSSTKAKRNLEALEKKMASEKVNKI